MGQYILTDPFTVSEPKNPSIGFLKVRSAKLSFCSPMIVKGSAGMFSSLHNSLELHAFSSTIGTLHFKYKNSVFIVPKKLLDVEFLYFVKLVKHLL